MRTVIISGLSGAGKSSAIKTFEDLGFYCVDNLPVPLLESFVDLISDSLQRDHPLALVIDARDKSYLSELPEHIAHLEKKGCEIEVVFLESSDMMLARRFSETRRKHPLAFSGAVLDGIAKERELLRPIRKLAKAVIDTTDMSSNDLRKHIIKVYDPEKGVRRLAISVTSFGFKYGIPLNADMVFDVRFLVNPFFNAQLKHLTGLHPDVIEFVKTQDDTEEFLGHVQKMLTLLIPKFEKESKSYLNVCIGCTGGKHRSVVFATELAKLLKKGNAGVTLVHRDIEVE